MEKPTSILGSKVASSCRIPVEFEHRNWNSGLNSGDGFEDDFDTESMLGEEIEVEIDSIMGSSNLRTRNYETGNDSWALKNGDGGSRWRFSTVNVAAAATVKKILVEKKKKVEELELGKGNWNSSPGSKLSLKLNYDDTKLTQIDLFSENGKFREADVTRYKEKKNMHAFSKKIRYQVRKVNADKRLRYKGWFVRRPNSLTCEDT
ncbi:hypothetical protein L1987_01738 [Smallanthus sonchifolius]|uniref:Uncharacterized protein n=1 Tax=Smallanthus sonchifolius TaxID=185202 RepID=A0ACB9K5W1_9ASTR|nr:hypothetical protein L1987_01738 [Smallanthus sonchifolius]